MKQFATFMNIFLYWTKIWQSWQNWVLLEFFFQIELPERFKFWTSSKINLHEYILKEFSWNSSILQNITMQKVWAWDKRGNFDFRFSEASFLLLNRTLWLFLKDLCLVASTFHFEAILPNRNRGQNFFDFSTLRVLVQISKN